VVTSIGIDVEEAVRIVRAALTSGHAPATG
jgi:hypothetical protein